MTTMVTTAVLAFVAVLQAATPVCPVVERVRRRPFAQETGQSVVVRAEQTEVANISELTGLPIGWSTAVSVECYQRAFADADLALDSLVDAVFTRLMQEPTLGGAVLQISPKGISFDYDSDGEQTACANLVFNVLHATSGASLA